LSSSFPAAWIISTCANNSPGPICSPGLSALKAVLTPEEHEYLYFVAKGDGGHVFSAKLPDHNRAVRQWARMQREQRQKENTP